LLFKPRFLLLDEPLSANDTERRLTMLAQLDTWFSSEPIPVLYVSHAQEELRRLTQQLIIMEQGAVRSRGATEALLNGVTDVDGESSDHSVDEEAIVLVAGGDQLSVVLQRAAGTALAEQPDLAPGDRVLIRRVPPDISGRDFTLQPQSDKDESETD
jgi:molybdate transport system ATP-binding protein